jgi:hypothetical protein
MRYKLKPEDFFLKIFQSIFEFEIFPDQVCDFQNVIVREQKRVTAAVFMNENGIVFVANNGTNNAVIPELCHCHINDAPLIEC